MDGADGTSTQVGRLLARLAASLGELDRLHHDITAQAEALAAAVTNDATDRRPRVYSIKDAARELGVSVSMLHKLLREHRLAHLKVGTRTLITADHLAQFRSDTQVAATPASAPSTRADQRAAQRAAQ